MEEAKNENNISKKKEKEIQKFLEDEINLSVLDGFIFWTKFTAVLTWIGSGFAAIGVVVSIGSIIGIIASPLYIASSVLSGFLGYYLWLGAIETAKLKEQSDFESISKQSISIISKLRTYWKIQGIVTIVYLSLVLLAIILIILFFTVLSTNSPDFSEFNLE